MPKKKSFTGDLFATDDELFGDAEESHEVNSEQNDPPAPSDQTDLTVQADQTDTEETRQEDNTDNTFNTDKLILIQETHPAEPTVNPPPAKKREETKSKRLNLLIRPGILKEFAKIAYMQQTSVNDLINQLITEHVEKKPETIQEYDRLFKDKNAR
ncbi:hypothetical protein NY406_07615 [Chlorobaculum sp. MV4-Y]|uniref:hypothetical protein n=1 Tax=Chlorobaculum sp. MV4-Y TaxID=2976335 RepID=UPI0021AFBDF4|nr:hypothetical protein [Chlorobaculum sp. MV4-Y]UWX57087.1 hypothetical protein NY406_07615 [Chlorobaculum sp. MV4-Y]